MNLSDPLERLRAVNPVPPGAALPPPDRVLFARITSGEPLSEILLRPRLAPRARRTRRLVPVLLVAGLLGGAATYELLRDKVTKPDTVECYEAADPNANAQIQVVDERGAVAACADLWQQGIIGTGTGTDVPPLVECVLPSGVAGVFPARPGEDVCARLTLPPVTTVPGPPPTTSAPTSTPGPPTTAGDVNARILAFRDAVAPQFLDSPCVEQGPATVIVRRELDRAGLGDWTIRAGAGFSATQPCVTLALRPTDREVLLVPTPRR